MVELSGFLGSRYKAQFSGVMTAIVTPFDGDNIDLPALERISVRQADSGIHGVVVCGSTGEGSSLSEQEYRDVISCAVRSVSGRIKVVGGLASNNLDLCLDRAQYCKSAGVDAILVVTPYYCKPSQLGLQGFFSKIADSVDLPVILYNVPSRTSVDLLSVTAVDICGKKNVVGLKDATGDLVRVGEFCGLLNDKLPKKVDFSLLSGEDATFAQFCLLGGCGVISVLSNIAPDLMLAIYKACKVGNYDIAIELQEKLGGLANALFCDSNPVPVKFALSQMGLIKNVVRLPLCPLQRAHCDIVNAELQALGLL